MTKTDQRAFTEDAIIDVHQFTEHLSFPFKTWGAELFSLLVGDHRNISSGELDRSMRKLKQKGFTPEQLYQIIPVSKVLQMVVGVDLHVEGEEISMFPRLCDKFTEKFINAFDPTVPGSTPTTIAPSSPCNLATWELAVVGLFATHALSSEPPTLLFSTTQHGNSLHSLVGKSKEYPGPFSVLFRDKQGTVSGALIDGQFRETFSLSKEGFDKNCQGACIFQLFPKITVKRWTGRESARNFFYLNISNNHRKKGLGFGGREDCWRLGVDEDLREVSYLQCDATFQEGPLIDGSDEIVTAELASVEVWGLGGEEAMKNFLRRKADLQELRNERKKVDKKVFVESEFDREMFFAKTFQKPEQL